jgi:hypothetical protein
LKVTLIHGKLKSKSEVVDSPEDFAISDSVDVVPFIPVGNLPGDKLSFGPKCSWAGDFIGRLLVGKYNILTEMGLGVWVVAWWNGDSESLPRVFGRSTTKVEYLYIVSIRIITFFEDKSPL